MRGPNENRQQSNFESARQFCFDKQREATSNKKMQLDIAKTIEGKID